MQRQSSDASEKRQDVESNPNLKDEPYVVGAAEDMEVYAEYEGTHAKEGHLNRGIQSRQIGMIAVSVPSQLHERFESNLLSSSEEP
jgi:hypothetical protein